jgi:serine/threonine protein phosphatase PrpC
MKTAHLRVGRDDRCGVWKRGESLVLAVADGAGGTGGGAAAAELVMQECEKFDLGDCEELLFRCDQLMIPTGGETTAVIAVVDEKGVRGASVGDSGAWLIESAVDLTSGQERKPLIGSGRACPVPFASRFAGTLLVASDGLLKYAAAAKIRELASQPDLDQIPAQLVDAVRLPSGDLQDDVCVIVCR